MLENQGEIKLTEDHELAIWKIASFFAEKYKTCIYNAHIFSIALEMKMLSETIFTKRHVEHEIILRKCEIADLLFAIDLLSDDEEFPHGEDIHSLSLALNNAFN